MRSRLAPIRAVGAGVELQGVERRPTTGGAILLAMFAIGAVLGAVAAVGSLFALVWP